MDEDDIPSPPIPEDGADSFQLPNMRPEEDLPEEEEKPAEEQAVEELTEEEQRMFTDALYIGRKEKDTKVCGHRVRLATLTVDEELQIALLIKPWLNTDGYQRAYKAAVVAASVREIDGEPVYQPMGYEDAEGLVQRKFERVNKFYPFFVDQIYATFGELEQELIPLLEKLGKSPR